MKRVLGIISFITLMFSNTLPALAGDPSNGIWKTEASEETGSWLHVKVFDCDDLVCGDIENAYSSDGEIISDYEHKGKPIIWGMQILGDGKYKKGKIWNPTNDKEYNSKMVLKGSILDVSGCVWGICQAQTWERVE